MNAVFGVCVSIGGVARIFRLLEKGTNYLKRDVEAINPANDSKYKQIARIVANILFVIGFFGTSVGMISLGATMIASNAAFFTGLSEAILSALPYFVASLGAMSANLIIRQIAR